MDGASRALARIGFFEVAGEHFQYFQLGRFGQAAGGRSATCVPQAGALSASA